MYPYTPDVPELDPQPTRARVRGRVLVQRGGRGPWQLTRTIDPHTTTLARAQRPTTWCDCATGLWCGPLKQVRGDVFAALSQPETHGPHPGTRWRVELRIRPLRLDPLTEDS